MTQKSWEEQRRSMARLDGGIPPYEDPSPARQDTGATAILIAAILFLLLGIYLVLSNSAKAAEPESTWRYYPFNVEDIATARTESGVVFEFSAPCAATARVYVEGSNAGRTLKVSGEVPTGRGSKLLSFPVTDLDKLRIDRITVTSGDYEPVSAVNPRSGYDYGFCGSAGVEATR